MKRPGLIEGIGVAAVASLAGAGLNLVLSPLFGAAWLLDLVLAGTSLGYVIYLLRRSPERIGRLSTLLGWLLGATLIAVFSPSLVVTALAHTGLIWLVRSLYHHASALIALADLGLSGLAFATAIWAAMQTGSLFAALWCFYLAQSLFVLLPERIGDRPHTAATPGSDDFQQAWRAAEAAARKLSSTH